MFIAFNGYAHHMHEFSGQMLLAIPGYRVATAQEAAECVNRLIINGDARMEEANDEFNRIYAPRPLSAAAEIIPLPNPACKGMPRVTAMLREFDGDAA